MYLLRRAAFKAVSSATAAPVARTARPFASSFTASPSSQLSAFRRSYADDSNKSEERKSAEETGEKVKEQAKDTVESVVESARDTVSDYASRASEAVSAGVDAVTSDFGGQERRPRERQERSGGNRYDRNDRGGERGGNRYDRNDRGGDRGDRPSRGGDRPGMRSNAGHPEAKPSTSLYVGNLYFEVSEASLRKEFERFGDLKSVKILYDARGLSKGFGYVEFEDQSSADEAKSSLNNQVLEGRRLAVQYSVSRSDRPRRDEGPNVPRNPPSKTLFIGNMSYEMTDKDLNELFREVKNVLDVRVAIDRRTGNPRGFAHADFADVASAEAAGEYLRSKTFYGRNLRVDYSLGTQASAKIESDVKEESL